MGNKIVEAQGFASPLRSNRPNHSSALFRNYSQASSGDSPTLGGTGWIPAPAEIGLM
ncbi:hypothetical protein [Pontibacter burrus]|uniref:Uncharacterized protein n=1 Tax=Pontibacter burrus TaxID=2704466 RepID=A0A6B3M157_9BACT|nr:hypothetical protein [Pontibacter burrus]NEM99321.1 hypothetical protein [Pontibacter burrus]